MIGEIAKKSLLSNMLTLRFSVGTVLFLVLAALFTGVLLDEYRQKLENYNGLVSRNAEELKGLMTYQNLKPTIYKPPEILTVFSKGSAENMVGSIRISVGEVPKLGSADTGKNPFLSVFPVLDIALIFKLVISVLAILLAYDAISGEREDETLKLMLSNSVPRHQILSGKFIGGMITLAIPIMLGFLVISLMLELSPSVELTGDDWIRIALMFVLSVVMVSVLFNLGLFFSAMTKRSSDTLMLLLFLWVLFLLMIPNGSIYVSARLRPILRKESVLSQVQQVWWRFQEEMEDYYRRTPGEGGYGVQNDASEPWGWYHRFATKSLVLSTRNRNVFIEPLRIKYADEAWQTGENYLKSMKRQWKLANSISRTSPLSLYENLISSLSRTDIQGSEIFAIQARDYRQQIIDYLYSKKAFSSIRYFATVKEEHLFDINNMDEWTALREKYDTQDPTPLEVSEIPRFHYRLETIAVTMKRILPDVIVLCFMSILFFMCAFAVFLRCDVR